MKPLVAIVGRPNVGKSTLFNRLIGHRRALVEDVPGVTRDRHYADAEWSGHPFTLIDTGGFVPGSTDALIAQVHEQAQAAIEECEAIILLADGSAGLTASDHELADTLRRSGKPIVLAVNKIDGRAQEEKTPLADFYTLGLGEVFLISAEHARGLSELLDRLVSLLPPLAPESPDTEDRNPPVRIAIVGRPNVGKSTLVNALLGRKRLVASELPGTTRDAIDSELAFKGRKFVLTDTAGIRRKTAIAHRVEHFAILAALKAIDRSDVAALVMDATEPAVDQDARIASIAEERGRALLLVVNKCDKLSGALDQKAFRAELKLKFVSYAPILFTSAVAQTRVDKVLEMGAKLRDQLAFRAPTPQLNRLLQQITEAHAPPFARGKPIRIYYIAQVGTGPPTFALTSNLPEMVPQRYKRYIVNRLRSAFGLKVPIRLLFRERPGGAKRRGAKRLRRKERPRRGD